MSSGGAPAPTSNYSIGTTGGSQETSAPAPGGKGGFPSAQNPYTQQQVYMPPQQPSYYQQAFPQQQAYTQSSFYAPPQQQGFMSPYSQNAYVQRRPYRSPSSPINAPQAPAAATRGIASDNINNPAYQQQMAASSMTDYQRLMQQQQMAGQSQQNYGGRLGNLDQTFRMPSDLEIANSLGYKDPSTNMMTDMRLRMPHEYEAERAANDAKAKEYLNSIGYGQAGFDASKYEVKRQPTSNYSGGFGSLSSGLGSLIAQPTGFNTNPMVG